MSRQEADLPTNELLHGDSREVIESFPDESVRLTVTSPPYNIGKDYGEGIDDRQPLSDWKEMLHDVLEEVFRVTRPDGKCVINVGASFGKTDVEGRYFRIPLNHHVIDVAHDVGFDLFDEYVWTKKQFASHGGGALFGSYPYPTNFMANQQHEYILVFRKWVSEEYHSSRTLPDGGSAKKEDSQLTKEEWRKFTQSVWDDIPSAKPSQIGVDHKAMFPVDLPERVIRMYSYVDDVVLDPFVGTGSTAIAAQRTDRNYIGIDLNEEWLDVGRKRLDGKLPRTTRADKRSREAQRDAFDEGQEQTTLDSLTENDT